MARPGPQLVVIEDLHWSTATTRDALRHVCRTGAVAPMLIVVTSRDAPPNLDDALAAYLSDLARQPTVDMIGLSGLSEHEVGDLLATTTSNTPAAEVYAATDGNPLLALEAACTDSGPSITGLLAARYDRLARSELDVVDVAVVVGSEFDVTLVAAAAGRTVEDTVKRVGGGRTRRTRRSCAPSSGRFSFVHALFRTARYDSLPTSARLQLHRCVAGALRPWADDERVLPVLAHHACVAAPLGDAEEAMGLARRAGQLAGRKFALDEAADHFQRALAMLDLIGTPDRGQRLRLEIDLAEAQVGAGHPDGRTRLVSAVDEARRRGDHEALVNATLALTRLGGRGLDSPVAAAFREALATIPAEPTHPRSTPRRTQLGAQPGRPGPRPRDRDTGRRHGSCAR